MRQSLILFLFVLTACNGGGGGNNSPGPTFTVAGTLTYDYVPVTTELDFAAKSSRPMRNVYIEAIRTSNGKTLDSTSTDDNGNYTLNVPQNSTIRLEIHAMMKSPSVRIEDNTDANAIYVAATNNHTISANTTINSHASCGWTGTNDGGSYTGTRAAAPFAILDSIYSAIKKIKAQRPSVSFPALKVNWSVNNVPASGDVEDGNIGTSHYDGSELYILGKSGVDTDEFDRHVIVHEWGHYFEDKLSRSDSFGGEHGNGDILDRTVAFGEAWGNALSGMVFDPSYTYLDSMWFGANNTVGISMNMETDTDVNPGWFSEVSIQQILFDIYDTGVEGHDSLDLGIGPIVDVMMNGQKTTSATTSVHSFIHYLKTANVASTAAINSITANKSITVNDIYGTGETNDNGIAALLPLYNSLTINGASVQVELDGGGYRSNEAPNNKYFRFTATASSTKINWTANDTYGVYVTKRGVGVFYDDEIRVNNTPVSGNGTFATTAGQEYIVQVFTDPSLMADSSQAMDIEISVE